MTSRDRKGADSRGHATSLMSRFAAKAGAQAVMHAGPGYYAVSQQELVRYVEELTSRLPLPLYLYNMPGFTHLSFAVETVAAASMRERVTALVTKLRYHNLA